MNAVLRYWNWVTLNWMGQRQVEEISNCRIFFLQQFSHLVNNGKVRDPEIQRQLVGLMNPSIKPDHLTETPRSAEYCLRCFISNEIDAACTRLFKQFGEVGGFTKTELLSLVLDDFKLSNAQHPQTETRSTYQSLADKILQTFDPERSQLSTWTDRLVKSHKELNRFLWECGIQRESDWAILNKCHPETLEQLLIEVYSYTAAEAGQAVQVLDSYQTVYLADRLQQNRSQARAICRPPTPAQLTRMVEDLQEKGILGHVADDILEQLEALAELIRKSRQPQQEPLPDDNYPQPGPDEVETEMQEFLRRYQQLLATQLDLAIQQVVSDRVNYLKKRNPPKHRAFLVALKLYCQGRPMKEIAPEVGLKQQYQVTRLLELKSLREMIQQRLLVILKEQVVQLASYYTDLLQLEHLEFALATEIDRIIQDARREDSSSKCSRESLFTDHLCHCLSSLNEV